MQALINSASTLSSNFTRVSVALSTAQTQLQKQQQLVAATEKQLQGACGVASRRGWGDQVEMHAAPFAPIARPPWPVPHCPCHDTLLLHHQRRPPPPCLAHHPATGAQANHTRAVATLAATNKTLTTARTAAATQSAGSARVQQQVSQASAELRAANAAYSKAQSRLAALQQQAVQAVTSVQHNSDMLGSSGANLQRAQVRA